MGAFLLYYGAIILSSVALIPVQLNVNKNNIKLTGANNE